MSEPRVWEAGELERDAAVAIISFRKERLEESLERYTHFFESFVPIFRELLEQIGPLEKDAGVVANLLRNSDRRMAFRYLAAPPISEDDLKVLAETTLSAQALPDDTDQARRIRDVVLHVLDPHRFPWVRKKRDPTEHERELAVAASAALVAARKVETERRTTAGRKQENSVKELLKRIGYSEVSRKEIPMLADAPSVGEFCSECKFGNTRADLVIRLPDGRVMAVECKASNSAVNSYKRINHEAVGKARTWLESFGRRQTIPGAVIAGVFNAANLMAAQEQGLFLFWSHRLNDLADFVLSTRPAFRPSQ